MNQASMLPGDWTDVQVGPKVRGGIGNHHADSVFPEANIADPITGDVVRHLPLTSAMVRMTVAATESWNL